MMEELVEIHATIKGRVQGVGFRATARNLAVRLGIVGRVRNLTDGSVEIYALGKRQTIEEMLKILTGPQGPGNISAVLSEEVFPQHHYPDFSIVF